MKNLYALKHRKENEYAFTLIELLVVILIIGVLASIAIPAFMNQRQRANDAALKSDMRNVAMLVHTWEAGGKSIQQDTRYVDATYHYVALVNTGSPNHWPVQRSGVVSFSPQFLEGYVPTTGTRLGVKVTDPGVGFCIAGAKDNSNYDSVLGTNTAYSDRMYFYDSANGHFSDRNDIIRHGSCEYFAKK